MHNVGKSVVRRINLWSFQKHQQSCAEWEAKIAYESVNVSTFGANRSMVMRWRCRTFRARIMELRGLWDTDWSDWEADWLDSQARRPSHYVPSDKERAVLKRLVACTRTFGHYDCFSVPEMLRMAARYLRDLDEDSEDFVKALVRRGAAVLRVRQLSRLAGICRLTEPLGIDNEVEAAMQATRHGDDDASGEAWKRSA